MTILNFILIAYINEMGPIYTLEYKNLIDKERKLGNNNISPIIDKHLRKANFNKIGGQNNLVALK